MLTEEEQTLLDNEIENALYYKSSSNDSSIFDPVEEEEDASTRQRRRLDEQYENLQDLKNYIQAVCQQTCNETLMTVLPFLLKTTSTTSTTTTTSVQKSEEKLKAKEYYKQFYKKKKKKRKRSSTKEDNGIKSLCKHFNCDIVAKKKKKGEPLYLQACAHGHWSFHSGLRSPPSTCQCILQIAAQIETESKWQEYSSSSSNAQRKRHRRLIPKNSL